MKQKLSAREYLSLTSMLFGLFFGAGNLIFPVSMGQLAGNQIGHALVGFLITGVGLPLLAVISLGLTRSEGVLDLSSKIGRRYGLFFSCALYLTIGPFFAIPRCVTVPFEVGVAPLLPQSANPKMALLLFSLAYFLAMLFFSLKPGKILTWVGKFLNPLFLVAMGTLVVTALLHPASPVSAIAPEAAYATGAGAKGFLEGYNTMDALAGLAFGIVVVNVIRGLGVREPEHVATCTVKAGLFSCLLMGAIYIAVAIMGTQSRGVLPAAANGGAALGMIARHYYLGFGATLLALTVCLCCLKTAVGLITSCAEAFGEMFPKARLSYRAWAVLFCVVTFLIANFGLSTIISFSLPVLMFLYPLAMTLIILALGGRFFLKDQLTLRMVTGFTLVAALFDLVAALPAGLQNPLFGAMTSFARQYLPLNSLGLGWMLPAAIGMAIGQIHRLFASKRALEAEEVATAD